jgi:hypothetical protein
LIVPLPLSVLTGISNGTPLCRSLAAVLTAVWFLFVDRVDCEVICIIKLLIADHPVYVSIR